MNCNYWIMANMQEWHQALKLFPVSGLEKSNITRMPRRKHKDWDPQITGKGDITRRRERNKLRMRQVRALENEEEAEKRREKNKLRMRQVRALENEIEAERRRERNKLRMRQVRAVEKMESERTNDYSTISVVPAVDIRIDDNCTYDRPTLQSDTTKQDGNSHHTTSDYSINVCV